MGGFLALSRGIDRVNALIGRSASWLILAAIILSAGNAVSRKVLNVSANWALELQWYLYGAAFMLAAAWTLMENEHIRIDIVYGRWSRRTQHWIDLIGGVLMLMPFAGLMVWYLHPWAMRSWRSGEMSMNSGGLALWPAKMILLTGFTLLFIQGISEIIKKIAVMRGVIADPTPFVSQQEAAGIEAQEIVRTISDALGPQSGDGDRKEPRQ